MTARRQPDLDLVLRSWLEEAAAPRRVDYLPDVLDRARHTRQRPGWTFASRWLPEVSVGRPLRLSWTAWTLLVLAMALALVVGILAVGSVRRLPPPFGLARPGLIALDLDHHIAVMNTDGTGLRWLTADGAAADTAPVWSPDGTRLAFWRANGGGHWTIVIADESGAIRASVDIDTPTRLPLPSGDPGWSNLEYPLGAPSFLEWSPDSRSIAFSQDVRGSPRAFVVGADGTALRQVGDSSIPAKYPSWSSDGTRLAFTGGQVPGADLGVWVMNADGTGAHRVTRAAASGYSFSYPLWQPGGELILSFACPSATCPEGQMRIYVVRSDGTGEREVSAPYAGPGSDWIPRWSPDGRWIAYQHFDGTRLNGQIRITRPDGSLTLTPAGQLDDPNTSIGGPLWSPDARTVSALLHAEPGAIGLMTLDLAGGRPPIIVRGLANQGGTSYQRLAP